MHQDIPDRFYVGSDGLLRYTGKAPRNKREAWSITFEKWATLAREPVLHDGGHWTCGLCLFDIKTDHRRCHRCPVGMAGYKSCEGSPYSNWRVLSDIGHARREFFFLVAVFTLSLKQWRDGNTPGRWFYTNEDNLLRYSGPPVTTKRMAWGATLTKWFILATSNEGTRDGGINTCGLCMESRHECSKCPIGIQNPLSYGCARTPFIDYHRAPLKDNAWKEFKFLLSVFDARYRGIQ